MNRAIADTWLEALTSGVYVQRVQALCEDGAHCALGVLCDLAVKAGVCTEKQVGITTTFDNYACSPPPSVRQWAEMSSSQGLLKNPDESEVRSVLEANDLFKMSFPEIALWIDKNCDRL